jgi:hypothetical protein
MAGKRSTAFAPEFFARLVAGATLRATNDDLGATVRTELAAFAIVTAAFRTAHIA